MPRFSHLAPVEAECFNGIVDGTRAGPDDAAVLDIVFDGRCGFCTRAAARLRRRDRHGRLRFHPFQRAGVLERFGLSDEQARGAAWAFERGERPEPGPALRGAAAVNRALDVALGTRVFTAVYRLPGIRRLEDRGYRWVADHRGRLRGATPWCEAHPDDCA